MKAMPEVFPEPKFSIGETVLYTQEAPLDHTSYITERRITGLLYNPDIEDVFEGDGWHYVLDYPELEKEPVQVIAPESAIAAPIKPCEISANLLQLIDGIELLLVSSDFWEGSCKEVIPQLMEAQKSLIRINQAYYPAHHPWRFDTLDDTFNK